MLKLPRPGSFQRSLLEVLRWKPARRTQAIAPRTILARRLRARNEADMAHRIDIVLRVMEKRGLVRVVREPRNLFAHRVMMVDVTPAVRESLQALDIAEVSGVQ